MKYSKSKLSLEEGIKREWIITNGLGGFCSSTIIGANTRRYHGLLIAPLMPPARRFLILSKVDESITIKDKTYNLYTNICENYISEGYKFQESFEKEYLPIFSYKVDKISLQKTICMEYGKNTVCIHYKIKNDGRDAVLNLAPIVNFRDFHQMTTEHEFRVRQDLKGRKVRLIIDDNSSTPIYMHLSEGIYEQYTKNDFRNMFYIEEEKRGFYPKENHNVPGVYHVDIKAGEEKELSFVCSLEDNIEQIDAKALINKEISRLTGLIDNTKLLDKEDDELIKKLVLATDNFIVYRPNFRLHTIIAGYPWFLDWGRDSLISFEGLLLKTNRFDIAKEILRTFIRDIKYGLVPNGYSGFDNRPLYNSVDASLLLFEQVKKYLNYTKDIEFIQEEIYDKLKDIINGYKNGIDYDDNNIYLDDDYLIVSGTNNTQNTWMDAKYNGIAITPRNGKAVEINAMWYNALKIMEELSVLVEKNNEAKEYAKLAKNCKKAFESEFYNKQRKCLYDVIGDKKVRPNQLFALSLTYPVIDSNSTIAKEIINTVEKKLLNKYGLKTLAKGEEGYVEIYEGNPCKRDMSYHQGITWVWLLGLYYNALNNILNSEKSKENKKIIKQKIDDFSEQTRKVFAKAIDESGCIGSISELYDSKTPQLPKGAIAQAWSVAEVLRIILNK